MAIFLGFPNPGNLLRHGLVFVRNKHGYSAGSSVQGNSSNLLLWKRNKLLVVIQT